MSKKRKLHYKDTDFLRFIAFIPVFLYCAFFLLNDSKGIIADATIVLDALKMNSFDFFFFLSALLLTSHALREYKYNSTFRLRNFYLRRILKIFPVLIPALIFGFLVHPWIINVLKLTQINIPKMTNYFFMFPRDYEFFSPEQYIYFAVLWSIIMFLLYYIVLGIILKFFKDLLKIIGFGLILIGLAARAYHYLSNQTFELDVLSFGVPVGFGMLFALIIRNSTRTTDYFKDLTKRNHAIVYMIGIISMLLGYFFTSGTIFSVVIPLITCPFYGYVILEQTFSKESIIKFRRFKIMSKMGKQSYGLIVYQSIILVITLISFESLELDTNTLFVRILFFLISLILTYLIANFSYRVIEKAALTIRREFKKS